MFKNIRTDRQFTVASVLLVLLAAFAFNPPEHRCRTQSTRNRQARTVRMDDHDGDHNRWHSHGFDNTGRESDKQGDSPDLITGPPGISTVPRPLMVVGFVSVFGLNCPARMA